jgi:hypothetical protein
VTVDFRKGELVFEAKPAKKWASAAPLSVDSQKPQPHSSTMRMTCILPDGRARLLRSAYPQEKLSQVMAGLLAKKLRADDNQLAKACRGANGL